MSVVFLLGAENSRAWPQSDAPDPAVERGRKNFEQSCGFCHGPDATGARGPDLVRSPLVAHDVKGDKIGEVIRLGRPDKGMPAMPLTDQQVLDIAAYLHARALEALRSAGGPKADPIKKPLTRKAEAGKTNMKRDAGREKLHLPNGRLASL